MPQLLSRCEVDFALLPHLKGWTCHAKAITKDFECRDIQQAQAFAEAVREKAQEMELHPRIRLEGQNKVLLTLCSGETGCLTDCDIRFAREIDSLAPQAH